MVEEGKIYWWTHGQFEPVKVEVLYYAGEGTWTTRELTDLEDFSDAGERDLYASEADALRAHLEWLEGVFYFIRDTMLTRDPLILSILTARIAIVNSKLDKGR